MSENNLRPVWEPADYEETVAEAAKHRAIPGAYVEQAALYAEAAEQAGRHRKPHVITAEVQFGTKAHEMILGANVGADPRAVIADGPARSMDEFTLERGEPGIGNRPPALAEGTRVLWKRGFVKLTIVPDVEGFRDDVRFALERLA